MLQEVFSNILHHRNRTFFLQLDVVTGFYSCNKGIKKMSISYIDTLHNPSRCWVKILLPWRHWMVIWCLSPVTPLTPLPLISHLNNWQWDGIRSVRTHVTQDGVRHSNKVLDTLTDKLQSTAALWLHNIIRIPYPESVNIYSIKISRESVSSVSLWAGRVCQNHNHLHAKMQLISISGNKLENKMKGNH